MTVNPRGKATATGYRDINMSVKFEGHVCEIQIQLAAILEVKHDQVNPCRPPFVGERFTNRRQPATCV